jgi:multiple sugar transport system permease protein
MKEIYMKKTFLRYSSNILLLAVTLMLLLPLLFMLAGSFMSASEVQNNYGGISSGFASGGFARLILVPNLFTLEQYRQALLYSPDYMYAYWNSILLLLPTLIGILLISPLAGFSLAKYRYLGIGVISAVYILLALLPYHTMIVPNYIILYRLGLLNTRASIWLTQIFHPLSVFICWRWMDKLPKDILENADIDGTNTLQKYVYIVLPQSRPAIATVLVLCAADLWGMIEQPLIFLNSPNLHPLSVMIALQGSVHITEAFVCGIIFSAPMVLLFLMLKDDFVYGTESIVLSGNSKAVLREGQG